MTVTRKPIPLKLHKHSAVTERDWRDLVHKIKEGECTPFLGAGANAGVLPSGTQLAESWADDFEFPLTQKRSDLPSVAQFVATIKEPDAMWPKDRVAESFRDRLKRKDIDDVLRARHPVALLAELPFSIFMTTNYDDLLFRALRLKGKMPAFEMCAWNTSVRDLNRNPMFRNRKESAEHKAQLSDPTPQNPVVFHLHGHYQYPLSMVLTEDDYYRFVVAMTQQPKNNREAMLPASIQTAAKFRMLLFIGYSLNDLSFQMLFRSLFTETDSRERPMSLAIQLPSGENPKAQDYLRKYYNKLHIKLFYEDATVFVTKLVERWRRYEGQQHSAA
jgi:SIR2-like domain